MPEFDDKADPFTPCKDMPDGMFPSFQGNRTQFRFHCYIYIDPMKEKKGMIKKGKGANLSLCE